MKEIVFRYSTRLQWLVPALVFALFLASCGRDTQEQAIKSAQGFLAKRDFRSAIVELRTALQRNPDIAEARFLLGKAFYESGDFPAAVVELRRALDLKYAQDEVVPLLFRAYLALGLHKKVILEAATTGVLSAASKADVHALVSQAYLETGDRAAAVAAIAASLEVKPGNSLALMSRARVLATDRRLPEAVAILDPLTSAVPANSEALKYKGDLLVAMGRLDDAIASYRKAIEVTNDYVNAHVSLAWALLGRSGSDPNVASFGDANKQLVVLKKVAPENLQTLAFEAQLLFLNKDYKAARDKALLLLKFVPDTSQVLLLAGAIEFNLNSFIQAEAYLSKALGTAPESVSVRRWLALTHLYAGQPAKALKALEPILGKFESNDDLLLLAGEIFLQNGDIGKAEEMLAKATRLNPDDLKSRTALAIVRLNSNQSQNGFQELQAIAARDTSATADMALVASYLGRKEFDNALKVIDALEKKRPNNPLVFDLRGRVQMQKKDIAAARASFEHALRIRPGYFAAAAQLAEIDASESDLDSAAKRFESIIKIEPKNSAALLALANLKTQRKAPKEEAMDLIVRAVGANPSDPASRVALINYHLLLKDSNRAVAAGQDASATIPDRPEILDALGRAQWVAGDMNQALATYGKFASIQPGSATPYLRMAEIHGHNKDHDSAARNLRKALEIQPTLIDAQRSLIGLEFATGKQQAALSIAREVQRQRPREAIGYMLEGDLHANLKSWNNAIEAFRAGLKRSAAPELAVKLHAALQDSGKSVDASRFATDWLRDQASGKMLFRFYLAERFLTGGDLNAAAIQYRALLSDMPESPEILNNLAVVSAKLKEAQALEYSEKANKLAPNQAPYMDTLGVILTETAGQSGRAVEVLRKAVQLAPQNDVIRLNLARALIKVGKTTEAKVELAEISKAGNKFPEQAEVSRLLKSL